MLSNSARNYPQRSANLFSAELTLKLQALDAEHHLTTPAHHELLPCCPECPPRSPICPQGRPAHATLIRRRCLGQDSVDPGPPSPGTSLLPACGRIANGSHGGGKAKALLRMSEDGIHGDVLTSARRPSTSRRMCMCSVTEAERSAE